MYDTPELPSKTDFATAYKALALVRGLSGDAKTVGAVILSHFNAKTGQCDPGTDRIAAKAGISTRNVVKATNALHDAGLVAKARHGGNGFRSSYQPKWARLREIVAAFEQQEAAAEVVNKRAPTPCTNVHLDDVQTFTLTHIRNSPKKLTVSDGAGGNVLQPAIRTVSPTAIAERVSGLVRESLLSVRPSHRALPSVAAAHAEAAERLATQIGGLGESMRLRLAGVDEAIKAAAVIEEQKRKGAGLPYLFDRIQSVAAVQSTGTFGGT